jgi:hypothetical protein
LKNEPFEHYATKESIFDCRLLILRLRSRTGFEIENRSSSNYGPMADSYTLILLPLMIWIYYKLARKEEQEALKKYLKQYRKYMQQTPMFFPKLTKLSAGGKSIN